MPLSVILAVSLNMNVKLADFVHIGPGTVLCGNVTVGKGTFVGANAVVRQGINIGSNCMIGAGAVVIKDVPDNTIVIWKPITGTLEAKHAKKACRAEPPVDSKSSSSKNSKILFIGKADDPVFKICR